MALKRLKFCNNDIEGIIILNGNSSKGKLVILLFHRIKTDEKLTMMAQRGKELQPNVIEEIRGLRWVRGDRRKLQWFIKNYPIK
jgi:hypothetical protein